MNHIWISIRKIPDRAHLQHRHIAMHVLTFLMIALVITSGCGETEQEEAYEPATPPEFEVELAIAEPGFTLGPNYTKVPSGGKETVQWISFWGHRLELINNEFDDGFVHTRKYGKIKVTDNTLELTPTQKRKLLELRDQLRAAKQSEVIGPTDGESEIVGVLEGGFGHSPRNNSMQFQGVSLNVDGTPIKLIVSRTTVFNGIDADDSGVHYELGHTYKAIGVIRDNTMQVKRLLYVGPPPPPVRMKAPANWREYEPMYRVGPNILASYVVEGGPYTPEAIVDTSGEVVHASLKEDGAFFASDILQKASFYRHLLDLPELQDVELRETLQTTAVKVGGVDAVKMIFENDNITAVVISCSHNDKVYEALLIGPKDRVAAKRQEFDEWVNSITFVEQDQ